MAGTDPLLGQTFSGFRVDALVGVGGMGAVYRATQLDLDRPVALKVMDRTLMGDEVKRARFAQEARAVSALSHPHIVTLYHYGQVPTGEPFLAMELLAGRSLGAELKAHTLLPQAQVLDLLEQVAAALSEAHAKGIIHRDLKPGNLMICAFAGCPGFIKVLDFGIAKVQGEQGQGEQLTREGTALGTPQYMAPEQITNPPVDHRADLYSLGTIAYRCLAGRLPYSGETAWALIASKIGTEAPDLRTVATQPISEALAALVTDLLRIDAAQRPASADAVLERVAAIRAQAQAQAPEASPGPAHATGDMGPWDTLGNEDPTVAIDIAAPRWAGGAQEAPTQETAAVQRTPPAASTPTSPAPAPRGGAPAWLPWAVLVAAGGLLVFALFAR